MKDETCVVVENLHIHQRYFIIKLHAPYISENCKPGNFIMLTVSSTLDPLLKRPFGIFQSEPPYIWLYYEVIGKGTECISSLTNSSDDNDTV